jgi:hypothetical protein
LLAALSSARFFGERLKNEFWKINGLKRSRNLKYGVFAQKRCDSEKIFRFNKGLKAPVFSDWIVSLEQKMKKFF